MTERTFEEWSNLGFKIIKGSKGKRVNGLVLFSDEQVTKYRPKQWYSWTEGLDHDSAAEDYGLTGEKI